MTPLLMVALLAAAPGQPLTLEEAERTAREHQPQLRQAHAGTRASLARADNARSVLLPQLTGRLGYTRSTANCARSRAPPRRRRAECSEISKFENVGYIRALKHYS